MASLGDLAESVTGKNTFLKILEENGNYYFQEITHIVSK